MEWLAWTWNTFSLELLALSLLLYPATRNTITTGHNIQQHIMFTYSHKSLFFLYWGYNVFINMTHILTSCSPFYGSCLVQPWLECRDLDTKTRRKPFHKTHKNGHRALCLSSVWCAELIVLQLQMCSSLCPGPECSFQPTNLLFDLFIDITSCGVFIKLSRHSFAVWKKKHAPQTTSHKR